MKRYLTIFLWLSGLFLFLLGGARLCLYGAQSAQNARSAAQAQQALAIQAPETSESSTPYERYKPFFDQNSDMVGWLHIDGTVIDYPVMQTPDEPNFYLKRNFDGERSTYGCLYVAEACALSPASDNVIIHGHNMKDGQMFGSLDNYRSEAYYREHPVIRFDTRDNCGAYQIIAVFATVPSEFAFYKFTAAQTPAEFEAFVAACREFSFYDTGETAAFGDKLLTLSTCEYSRPNSRLVVVAKRIEEAVTAFAAGDPLLFRDANPMVADPDSSRAEDYFSPSTLENGYLWVDKSVNVDGDEFLVTLSALSQSYSVETLVEPTDAVFILDVSGSMDVNKLGDVSRATVMVEALNGAVETLMRANPANRVSVVAYGGALVSGAWVTRSYNLLNLGHYSLPNGQYFMISGNQISVSSALPDQAVPDRTVFVTGGTPTQRGIYEGAKILMDNPDTTIDHVTEKGRHVTLTRRPALILLTDGEPTYAWRNYRVAGQSTDNGYDSGNGSTMDMGLDLLTIATASYWKQQIQNHYYGAARDKSPQFFTIGVGVSSPHALAVMDPETHAQDVSQTLSGTTYNLKTLLDRFVTGADITFPVLNKGSTARSLTTISNPGGFIETYAYTDGYFPADDAQSLKSAFEGIAARIISRGYYTTESEPARPDFSGYVIFSDPIGKYMRFEALKGFWIEGELHYGRHFAMELSRGPSSAEWALYTGILAERLGVSRAVAEDIITTSIAGGALYYNSDTDYSSTLRWYADSDTEYAGLYYDALGSVNPRPGNAACFVELHPLDKEVYNEVAGEYTNLMYMYMSVTTALEEGSFGLKSAPDLRIPLLAGQQLVRWYIPASLIPMRTVSEVYDASRPETVSGLEIKETLPIRVNYTVRLQAGFDPAQVSASYKSRNGNGSGGYFFYSDDWRFGGAETFDTTLAIFQPNRENPYYYFTADTPVYLKNGAGQYEPANIYLPGVEYYVRTEYFDQLVPGYLAYSFTPVDQAVTRIAAGPDGVPYVPAGEHRAAAAIAMKTENRTESYAFRQEASALGQFQLVLLGNNGRIEIRDLARLSARKVWEGSPLDSVWVRLYADGAPIRAAVQLNAANSWRYTWDELLQYPVKAEADGTVARIAYTVAEGSFENGIFTPYGASHTPEGYHIRYSQPAWDDVTGWSEAVITDRAPDYVELKGLPPPSQEPESEPSNPPETPETSEPQEIPALPQTGDGAIPALWLAAMAAGAAALISAVKRYGKK